ncbi:AglZ/HisF2 family acetamidino modification protein [Motiliproteus sediminis]|uniref:AglZ/HisF2 family acetamidino modification protein n=1 Tax=Motiliproteus sediminis TaxID=1468178 RepID=UPI001AEF3D34|nr:AglZ/HisF2 family acetamidino modification protein [Motiliproteus sediminis]
MLRTRVIPCLLLKGKGLVKTTGFKNEVYVGDPINAVRIFNQMEVDELFLLDIDATARQSGINFELLEQVASECFMPICYGGGVSSLKDYERLFTLGVEKVSVSHAFFNQPELVKAAVSRFGSQSIVLTLDIKRHWLTKKMFACTHNGRRKRPEALHQILELAQELGVGEIVVNSIDRDGTWAGFDRELIQTVSSRVSVPVVALGGAGKLEDIKDVVDGAGASAVGIGSMAVFQGKGLGVLIKFPKMAELDELLGGK